MSEMRKPRATSASARFSLKASLRRSFADDTQWPIEPGELAALIDMGMSDVQIAEYFSIQRGDVDALRERYGMS